MAADQEWGGAGPGGFLRVLGIIYLVKRVKQRRRARRARAAAQQPGQG